MDIKGLRTLNLIGTILFCLIGLFFMFAIFSSLFYYHYNAPTQFGGSLEFSTRFIGTWTIFLAIYFIITALLYRFTVLSLDRGEYKSAKRWTLVAIFLGLLGGVIPFIIFIISYATFNEALRNQQRNQAYYYYWEQKGHKYPCAHCQRTIPIDSRLCPYCGVKQYKTRANDREIPPTHIPIT